MLEASTLAPAKTRPPFADDGAGADYFLSDFHLQTLISTICASFARGVGVVLLHGEPAASGELLVRYFEDRRHNGYHATLIQSRPGNRFVDVVGACCRELSLANEVSADQEADNRWALLTHLMGEARSGTIPVLLIDSADTLDHETFDEILQFSMLDEPRIMPIVLLGTSSGLAKFDAPASDAGRSSIAAHLSLQRLEREEVGAFIDHQLRAKPGAPKRVLSTEDVASIAASTNGDPALVNRMARLALSIPESVAVHQAVLTDLPQATPGPPRASPPGADPNPPTRAAVVAEIRRRMKSRNPLARLPIISGMRIAPTALKIGILAGLCVAAIAVAGAAILVTVHRSGQPPKGLIAELPQSPLSVPSVELPIESRVEPHPSPLPAAAVEPLEEPAPPPSPPPSPLPEVAESAPAVQNSPPALPAEPPIAAAASPAPVPAPDRKTYRLQLGALPTLAAAARRSEVLKQRHADLLGELAFSVQRADLGSRGLFYRIQVGPIVDAAQAHRQCEELKHRGESCIIVKP